MIKYILELENYLIPIEQIVKKYIVIKDIEYCLFSSKLRYPLLDKSICNELYREPQMSMYCAPMIKDVIKYLFAKNSSYSRHFFSNVISNNKNHYKVIEGIKTGKVDADHYSAVNIENIILKYVPNITLEDIDMLEKLINSIDDYINTLNVSYDHVIEIDDEYIFHVITLKRHILDVRIKELEK